jgi:hypothetical protein
MSGAGPAWNRILKQVKQSGAATDIVQKQSGLTGAHCGPS